MGTLVDTKEYVRPVRVEKKCGCLLHLGGDGEVLVLRGMAAGRPARYMYSCPSCHEMFYLEEPAVTIQYEVIQQGE